jgi:hypothetical protein
VHADHEAEHLARGAARAEVVRVALDGCRPAPAPLRA